MSGILPTYFYQFYRRRKIDDDVINHGEGDRIQSLIKIAKVQLLMLRKTVL